MKEDVPATDIREIISIADPRFEAFVSDRHIGATL